MASLIIGYLQLSQLAKTGHYPQTYEKVCTPIYHILLYPYIIHTYIPIYTDAYIFVSVNLEVYFSEVLQGSGADIYPYSLQPLLKIPPICLICVVLIPVVFVCCVLVHKFWLNVFASDNTYNHSLPVLLIHGHIA